MTWRSSPAETFPDVLDALRGADPAAAEAIDLMRAGLDELYLRSLTPSVAARIAPWLREHPEYLPPGHRRTVAASPEVP